MNRKSFGKLFAGVVTAGLLATAIVPSAIAAPPRWSITSSQETAFVSGGSAQAFDVTIVNKGPSNISSMYLLASQDTSGANFLTDAPVFISTDWPTPCVPSNGLLCDFGAVNAGTTIHVRVAYTVPFGYGGNTVYFELNTTGLVLGGNNSHGDAAFSAQTVTVIPGTDVDRAGKWTLTSGDTLANSQAVSNANPQATKLLGLGQYIPTTVEDGASVTFSCSKQLCKGKQFGQWSKVSVNGGTTFPTAFNVVITVAASALPANLDPTKVIVYHVLDNGTVETITAACTVTPPTGSDPECRTGSFDGAGNLVLSIWTYKNGGYKGAL